MDWQHYMILMRLLPLLLVIYVIVSSANPEPNRHPILENPIPRSKGKCVSVINSEQFSTPTVVLCQLRAAFVRWLARRKIKAFAWNGGTNLKLLERASHSFHPQQVYLFVYLFYIESVVCIIDCFTFVAGSGRARSHKSKIKKEFTHTFFESHCYFTQKTKRYW